MRTYLRYQLAAVLFLFYQISHAQAPKIVVNPLGHSAKIHNVLYTPDGRQIISISEDKTVRIWNAETGTMVRKFESLIGEGPEGMLYASAISPDGRLLAIAGYKVASESENYIAIIDLQKGIQAHTAIGHIDVINSLSFSGNGRYLASGGADNSVKIWRVDDAPILTVVTTIAIPSQVMSVAFNNVTQDLAVVHESNDILVYPLAALDRNLTKFLPRVFKKHKGPVNKIAYTLDGSYLASSSFNNELILWKPDGTTVKEFEGLQNPINAIAFSADSKIMVGLDVAGKGFSWGIPTGNKFTDFNGHDNTVFSAAFAPSLKGNYVVASAGGINNEILLWNPINGLTVKRIKGKGNALQHLAFGAGLELLIGYETSKEKKPIYKNAFDFESLTLSRTPGQVATAQETRKGISLSGPNSLDPQKGKRIQTDPDVDGRILDYHGLADGSVIVASDFSLKLFDKNGYLSKEFVGHYGAVRTIAISEDGRYLASGGEDQAVILWKLSDSGFAPTLRQAFEGKEWSDFFSSLEIDSLTNEPTKKAWREVITFLKSKGNKSYKTIEEVYRGLGEQVIPFATLFVTEDHEWICWTPRGYFSCSSSGGQYFGWHVNKGINQLAEYFDAEQYFELLYRPNELSNSFKAGKRVEEILVESGERIFDLSKLHRPSVAFFDVTATTRATDLLRYDKGKYFTQARTVPLTIDIYDGGGGVQEVNIYQNDKLIISDKDVKTTAEGQKRSKTYAVEMANETNVFKVKVVNFQKIESRVDELVIEYAGEVIATSTLHVLAVGINKYKNASYNLNYAQPDASSFVEKLNERSRTIFKSVNKVEIYDEDATKENIATGFKAMIARAKPEDVFLFYYAGHGTLDEDNNEEYYLVPTDVTKLYGDPEQLRVKGISATDIKGFLTQIKSQKQIVLMDACHSGGAVKSFSTRGVATDEKAMVQLARSSGVVMIASSGTKQFSTEFEALKHGVFTYALLEALDGKADNGDRKITVNEIKFYMEDRVPELTRQYGGQAQYPTGYITGNDFPISVLEK